jgi:hypothetical protein
MKNERLIADDHGVTGVRAALIPRHDVGLLAQEIDDLSFSLVAPLGADDDTAGHARTTSKRKDREFHPGGSRSKWQAKKSIRAVLFRQISAIEEDVQLLYLKEKRLTPDRAHETGEEALTPGRIPASMPAPCVA